MTLDQPRPSSRDEVRDIERIAKAIPRIPNDFRELRQLLNRIEPGVAPTVRSARDASILPSTGAGGVPVEQALSLVSPGGLGETSGGVIGVYPELFYGNTNLLDNPELVGFTAGASPGVSPAFASVGPGWRAKRLTNSGTPPVILYQELYDRFSADDNPMNSSLIAIESDTTTALAFDTDLDLQPSFGWEPTISLGETYLVAACRVMSLATLSSQYTVTATMRLLDDSGVVLATSEPYTIPNVADNVSKRLWASYFSTDFSAENTPLHWQLRIHVVRTAGGAASAFGVYVGEPSLALSTTQAPPPYSPIIGKWVPDRLIVRDTSGDRILSIGGTDAQISFADATGSVLAKLTLAGEALQLASTGGEAAFAMTGRAAPPATPGTGGILWWDNVTKHFWQTDDAGVDTDLTAGGGGGPATQVSRDATAGTSDYVARARIVADAIFRLFLGFDATDRPVLEFGTGAAGRDVRLLRGGTGELRYDTNGTNTDALIRIESVVTADPVLALRVAGDAVSRVALWGGSTNLGLEFGGGAATRDWRIRRQSGASGALAAGSLVFDSNGTASDSLVVIQALAGQVGGLFLGISTDSVNRTKLAGDASTTGLELGSGSAARDWRIHRDAAGGGAIAAGSLVVDRLGTANPSNVILQSTAGQVGGLFIGVAGDSSNRVALRGDATLVGIEFGPGSGARDWQLSRTAANVAAVAAGDTLDLNAGGLRLPVGTAALTATEGYAGWQSTTKVLRLYDGVRERSISDLGWTPYAYPIVFEPSLAFTTAATLPISGGSIAIPIWVDGHMLLQSVSYRAQAAAGTSEWRLYQQRQNSGSGSENTLDEVAGANGTGAAQGAAATVTSNAATPGTYLAPGLYWLVIRCTSGATAFPLGSTAASAAFAVNTAQTKTLGSALGATLDFVAATWTKVTAVYAVRLNGRAFGQTAAF